MNEDVLAEAVVGLIVADLTHIALHDFSPGDADTGDDLMEVIRWLTNWEVEQHHKLFVCILYLRALTPAIMYEGPRGLAERRNAVKTIVSDYRREVSRDSHRGNYTTGS